MIAKWDPKNIQKIYKKHILLKDKELNTKFPGFKNCRRSAGYAALIKQIKLQIIKQKRKTPLLGKNTGNPRKKNIMIPILEKEHDSGLDKRNSFSVLDKIEVYSLKANKYAKL